MLTPSSESCHQDNSARELRDLRSPLGNRLELLQSQALLLENSLNPNQARREAVALLLSEAVAIAPNEADLAARIDELIAKGFKSFDAYHLASAELSGVAAFLTVDLQLLRLAARVSGELYVPVTDPVQFIEEISQWRH